jgi:hypothetical protein
MSDKQSKCPICGAVSPVYYAGLTTTISAIPGFVRAAYGGAWRGTGRTMSRCFVMGNGETGQR